MVYSSSPSGDLADRLYVDDQSEPCATFGLSRAPILHKALQGAWFEYRFKPG